MKKDADLTGSDGHQKKSSSVNNQIKSPAIHQNKKSFIQDTIDHKYCLDSGAVDGL